MTTTGIAAGTRLGDFVIEALIGTGGMGEVYRARQLDVDRPVALKVLAGPLAGDGEFVRRFKREAGTMRDLEHPGILTVYSAGEDGGRVYLAMRLVDGPTLKDLLARRGPLLAETPALLAPLADALDYAHARGVIHRDIKPANILLDADGHPFLADFGISKQLGDSSSTMTGGYVGTPRYMAPEQGTSGGTGHRADLYSLACVAFEMLTGSAPFTEQDTAPLLLAHATKPVPRASELNPELPVAVDAVLARGMAKVPTDRYPSARAFVDDLAAALAPRPTAGVAAAGPPGPAPAAPALVDGAAVDGAAVAGAAVDGAQVDGAPVDRRSRRGPRRLVIGGVAAVVLVGLLAALLVLRPFGSGDGGDSGAQRPATSGAPAATAGTSLPTPAAVPRGQLLYQAAFGVNSASFYDAVGRTFDPAKETVRHLPGALALDVLAPGGYSSIDLRVGRPVTTYVGDIDFAMQPGTTVEFCWSLRWAVPGQLAYYWCVNPTAQTAEFYVFNGQGWIPISSAVPVPRLQSGRMVQATIVVRDTRLQAYLDGALVTDVQDSQVPVSPTIPGLELGFTGGTGSIQITGLRLSALPAP